MALDDFANTEVGIAVAATAMICSPRVRNAVRRGLVLGLAGVMKAADSVGDAARNVAGEAQNTVSSTVSGVQDVASSTVAEARAKANQPRATGRASRTTTPNEK
jgi:hypothetical protein